MKLIVADSGPLIALANTRHINTLLKIIPNVVIPETVYLECTVDNDKPGARLILETVTSGRIQRVADPDAGVFANIDDLDAGEVFALALAARMKSAVLMDDGVGREVAAAHKIGVIGGCGILLKAKQLGLIIEIAPILKVWKEDFGYFLSDALIAKVLNQAKEQRNPPP